ncbi:MAG: DinB family protein [Dehalococcoidales bacterium]|nr:DinB family protein [Dehalococcoidales bacterium]
MNWQDLLIDGYGRTHEVMKRALNGMTRDDLDQQPHPDTNSMGWLAWHLSRLQDDHIASLMGEQQLWISEQWHAKFGRPADPKDVGFGHSPADVAAFRSPDAQTLLAYYEAVLERTNRYIRSLSAEDLDRELNEPWYQPLPTVGVRLVSVMSDNLQHVGQIAYVRGFLKGKGWQKF